MFSQRHDSTFIIGGSMKEKNINYLYSYEVDDQFFLEDIENRRIFLYDDISSETIDHVVYHVLRYNRLDKDIPIDERKPIILYINSPGGSVTDGFAIIDCLLLSKTPIYTVNIATCYSMGFLIFLAGSKRFALPSSTYLCHDGGNFAYDSTAKLKDRMEFELGAMEEHTKEYVISRTNISSDLYDVNYRKEWYFYPDEAKKYGVVTDIVGIDCDINSII